MRVVSVILSLVILLPTAASARDDVAAAVVLREVDVELDFEDGSEGEVRIGRYGFEYWEPVATNVQMGFALGYSGNDGRDAARPFENLDGRFGGLGMRFDVPFRGWLSLAGELQLLYQRDRHSNDQVEFESRLRETRASLGPVVSTGALTFSAGGAWRNLDYREIVDDGASELVRHADAAQQGGAFAALGLRTDNDGHIVVRYDAGYESGWTLRFERTF